MAETDNSNDQAQGQEQDGGDTDEGIKKWQRIADKNRELARKYQKDALESSALRQDIGILQQSFAELAKAIKDGADDEAVDAVLDQTEQMRKTATTANKWRTQISEALGDDEWDDGKFDTARQHWESREYEAAYAEVLKQTGSGGSMSGLTIDDIREAIKGELSSFGVNVDTGGPIGTGRPGQVTRQSLQEASRSMTRDPKAGIEAVKRQLDSFYKV